MTHQILVTGGTGRLGRALVPRLRAFGHTVRVLSRTAHSDPGALRGDLLTGEGLDAALDGTDTVVHCATTNGRRDTDAMRHLVEAARRCRTAPHLLHVSIVGIDRIGLPYYRAKQECERMLERSGLPWTVQRTTQFHDLVAWVYAAQRRLPVLLAPAGVSLQPVDTRDVADRLTALVAAPPRNGRAEDMGGPEVRTARDLARVWLRAHGGRHRPVLPVRVPGGAFRAYRAGAHLAPERAEGRITFDAYLNGRLREHS
ncbi:NAD(P)H-binding protein [Streptomyces sp. 891-h]|uniref:SDR family oxidoreductase n=1 Tax=Streptomyces sp. 891-h TaxID=2720714 RepID=UPI001FAA69D7|nr:NAD(P)H-binding protein [Streptomyces sp. 891-h]UNZ17222.1 NAD(P)H-binding protein [Streptomyces sp. 891-h]